MADPVVFTCRLLRKVHRAAARARVTAPAATLEALDEALWTFDPEAFIPHVRVPGPAAALAGRTPIWLGEVAAEAPEPPVLINLGAEPPVGAGTLERVIEIVGTDPQDIAGGRSRWRHYESWGVRPVHHVAVPR